MHFSIEFQNKIIANNQNEVKNFASVMQNHTTRMKELDELVKEFEEKKMDKGDYEKRITNIQKEVKMAWDGIIKAENMIRSTDNYLDRYLPIHMQCMIDDTVYHTVLKKKEFARALNEYEKVYF